MVCFFLAFSVFAGSGFEDLEVKYPGLGTIERPEGTATRLEVYLPYLLHILIAISGAVTFIAFVWGGFVRLTAGENPGKIQESKDRLISAVWGFMIVISAFVVLRTIHPGFVELQDVGIDQIESFAEPGVYISTENNFPNPENDDFQERMREEVRMLRGSIRNLGKFQGEVRAIRIVNNYATPDIFTPGTSFDAEYVYGAIVREEVGFRGRCMFYVNDSWTVLAPTHRDISIDPEQQNISSITVVMLEKQPSLSSNARVFSMPDFPDPEENEDVKYQDLLHTSYGANVFSELEADDEDHAVKRDVWSLKLVEEKRQIAILTDGEEWKETDQAAMERCDVFWSSERDLEGYGINRCLPEGPEGIARFWGDYESCATHYAIFSLYEPKKNN